MWFLGQLKWRNRDGKPHPSSCAKLPNIARPTPKVRTIFCSSLCQPRAKIWLFSLLQVSTQQVGSCRKRDMSYAAKLVLAANLHISRQRRRRIVRQYYGRGILSGGLEASS